MTESESIAAILTAMNFAARKHINQRRKELAASPYINHPIEVAELIARIGRVTNPVILMGAILHDTLEDTKTTAGDLESLFGKEVRKIVEEVTDNKKLDRETRKTIQIESAPGLSPGAKLIKMADKIANVRAVINSPPFGWTRSRRKDYMEWSEKVVAGCRGINKPLEDYFDMMLKKGLLTIT